MKLLGIDTGGTFTDFVYLDGEQLRVHKVLSTPDAPERAILQGIQAMGMSPGADLLVIHGSTVATNAVLEGKGVRTAYIANRGLADVLTIGRQARAELYELQPPKPAPPVPPALCHETGGRLAPDGSIVEPLTEDDLSELHRWLEAERPEAVAINLLFSFVDDSLERRIEAHVPQGIAVSRSSEVLPEYREYERGMATWLNAYVGPLIGRYIGRLQEALGPAYLTVMQSHGGTLAARKAGSRGVQLLLSGPAGGLMGARYVAAASGVDRLLTFDMGGTSTDVALIDGEVGLTSEGHIATYPVAVPMVDMHTIGAGGGSIAYLDAGGLLQVGPESAGADPGPACYGQGGTRPTVTDANLVLGRLPADVALGGGMSVDLAAAQAALQPLAEGMGRSVEAAAEGVLQVANERMAQALRVISVQRGMDPAAFALLSFGGAGGLHVCALAEAMGMDQALVPIHGGVLSALGMLVAPRARQLSRTVGSTLDRLSDPELEAYLDDLLQAGQADLAAEGITDITVTRSLDLRYEGQSTTLNLPWSGLADAEAAFHARHREQYGHALDVPVELVNVRVGLTGGGEPPDLPRLAEGPAAGPEARMGVYGIDDAVPVYRRDRLPAGQTIEGPAIVTEPVATTYIAPGWRADVDPVANLLLTGVRS